MLQKSVVHFFRFLPSLFLLLPCPAAGPGPSQPAGGAIRLEPGPASPIPFEKPGSREFPLRLGASEFLELSVSPHHLEIDVQIVDPDATGADIACARLNGVVQCGVIAAKPGVCRVHVEATGVEPNSAARCDIEVSVRRDATPNDRASIRALRLAKEANAELGKGKPGLPEAIRGFEASLTLFETAANAAGRARAAAVLGNLYFRRGETDRARETLEQALRLSQAEGDFYSQAAALYTQARLQATAGDNEQAIRLFQKVVPLRESVGDGFGTALALHNLASAHWALGETAEALEYYRRALEIRERIQDQAGVSYTLYGIAVAHWTRGADQEALDCYQRALDIWRGLRDPRGEADTLNSIGLIYSGLREGPRALRYFDQALAIWKSLGDPSGEAYTRNNMGMVYADQGETKLAWDAYQDALGLLKTLNDPRGEAYVHHNLGGLLLRSGDPERALGHLQLSLQMKEKLGDRFGQSRTLDRLGDARLLQGRPAEASRSYERALALQEEIGDRHGKVLSLGGLARAQREMGRLRPALERVRSAIELIESLRLTFRSDDLRTSFFAGWRDYYGFEIDLLMRLHGLEPNEGYPRQALEVSEQARSRALLEALSRTENDRGSSGQSPLVANEAALRRQIEQKAESLERVEGGGFSKRQREKLEEELDQLLETYKEVRSGITKTNPHYWSLLAPRPFGAAEQREIIDDDTLFLEFFLGKERSFVWALTSNSIDVFQLPAAEEINTSALRLYDHLTARNRRDDKSRSEARRRVEEADIAAQEEARSLGRTLLDSLPARLRRKRLLVAADGLLHYVPFHVLPPPKSWTRPAADGRADTDPYLGLSYEMVSAPSLAVLEELRRAPRPSPGSRLLAVFADPVFDRDDPRLSETLRDSTREVPDSSGRGRGDEASYRRLRFSRSEAEEIAQLAPSTERLLALGFSADRRTFEATPLREFRFLHFATHTVLDNQHPELSGIVLSLVDDRGRRQDGLVRLYEIYNLRLNADLVVLSSCRTALGKMVGGEGLVGLARGFLYAGAASVMASLWQIEDRASSVFMKRFYSEMLKENKSRPEALLATQRAMFEDGRWRAPYYWAPFILQGDWR